MELRVGLQKVTRMYSKRKLSQMSPVWEDQDGNLVCSKRFWDSIPENIRTGIISVDHSVRILNTKTKVYQKFVADMESYYHDKFGTYHKQESFSKESVLFYCYFWDKTLPWISQISDQRTTLCVADVLDFVEKAVSKYRESDDLPAYCAITVSYKDGNLSFVKVVSIVSCEIAYLTEEDFCKYIVKGSGKGVALLVCNQHELVKVEYDVP